MIVITGATGQLGRLVIQSLLAKLPATQIVAAVRNPARAVDLAAQGVQIRQADYTDPASLVTAFQGAEKVLLISSSEIGQRAAQHRNVIDAAKKAGVSLVAYTSILHADRSPLGLAAEHAATEAYLRESGMPNVLLRNGWYTENYLASVPPALQHGAFIGSAGEGRISSAARADYAEAAAVALTAPAQAALLGAGLPEPIANLLADSDVGASKGGLFDDQHQLSALIGRPTTSLAALMQVALK